MKMVAPVSAVITTYNTGRFLAGAVANVQAQSVAPGEIIIVDDGSTDGTDEVAAVLRGVRYVRKANGGAASARNCGLRESRCELIAYLDADDLWVAQKLEWQYEEFLKDAGLELCSGLTQLQVEGEEGYRDRGEPWGAPSLGAMLIRRRLFERIGEFDEGLRTSEDLEWVMRARRGGVRQATVPRTVQHYQLRAGSLTTGRAGRERDMLAALRKTMKGRTGGGTQR
jgi:glycosyltransferase involved in cell wall biosynthesis